MEKNKSDRSSDRPIDLLLAANKGKIKNIRIELPPFEAYMGIDDAFLIIEERDIIKKIKIAENEQKGLDRLPINKRDWEKEFNESLDNQREAAKKAGLKFDEKAATKGIEAEKPVNLAEQLANRWANMRVIEEIIPKIIKQEDGMTPMFPTLEEQEKFKKLIRSDTEMFTYLTGKCTEAIMLWNKKKDDVKNSSPEANSGNGDSRSDAPDVGDTGDLSTRD